MELPLLTRQLKFSSSSTSSTPTAESLILYPLLSSNLKIEASSKSDSSSATTSTLQPLLLMLARTPPLLRDIQSHLQTSFTESSLSLDDLIEAEVLASEIQDTDTAPKKEILILKMKEIMGGLDDVYQKLNSSLESSNHRPLLPSNNSLKNFRDLLPLELLTSEQVDATLAYVLRFEEMRDAGPEVDDGYLIAHSYVRYLGDLSGGQHISKRVKTRWPISSSPVGGLSSNQDQGSEKSEEGFEFYDFTQLGDGKQVKKTFKDGMNEGLELASGSNAPNSSTDDYTDAIRSKLVSQLLIEASLSFDLNRALFDALVPADLASSSSEEDEALEFQTLPPLHKSSKPLLKALLPCPISILRMLRILPSKSTTLASGSSRSLSFNSILLICSFLLVIVALLSSSSYCEKDNGATIETLGSGLGLGCDFLGEGLGAGLNSSSRLIPITSSI